MHMYILSIVFPGYEYNEQRKCYFRVPPKHFGSLQNQDEQGASMSADQTEPSVTVCSKYSLYNLTRSRMLEMCDKSHSVRYT